MNLLKIEIDNYENEEYIQLTGSKLFCTYFFSIDASMTISTNGPMGMGICYGHLFGMTELRRYVLSARSPRSSSFQAPTFVVMRRDLLKFVRV
jgi:hypothetical protein